jgi:type I restriction enzyme S subunit
MKVDKRKWERKKLGDLCDILNGLWKGKKAPFINVGVIRNTNFTKNCLLDFNDIAYLDVEEKQFKSRKLQKGDIIIEKSGGGPKQPVGRAILFEEEKGNYSFSNFTSVLRLRNNFDLMYQFLHKYLYFFYVSGRTIRMQNHLIGIHNLDFEQYKNISIPVPPLSEQQAIASELDAIQDLISKHKEQLKDYDNLAKSIFNEMFGDVVSNEKGWKEKKLDELCTVTSSKRIYKKEWANEGIPFLRISDLHNLIKTKGLTFSLYISIIKYEELVRNGLVPIAGDILITSRGTLGECYIVNQKDKFYFQDGMITWLSNINKNILPIFIDYVFEYPAFKNVIDKLNNGSTVSYLSIGQIKRIDIPLPPLSLQQTFAHRIEAIEKQKELVKQQITDLQTLFDSRMQYYFD